MQTFYQPLYGYEEFKELQSAIQKKKLPVQVNGCIDSQKCHLVFAASQERKKRLIITYNDIKAKEIYEDCRLYDREVYLYPAKDIIFFSADIHGNAIVRERLRILRKLLEDQPVTVIATVDAGMDKVLPIEYLSSQCISIEAGQTLNLEELQKQLVNLGYERQGQVESAGEFAVRGGILDVFPLTEEVPVRIELWGDEVDSIRSFDAQSQRSIENLDEIKLYPAAEFVLDEETKMRGLAKIEQELEEYAGALRAERKTEEAARIRKAIAEFKENLEYCQGSVGLDSFVNFFFDKTVSFFDYFQDDESIIFLDEPARILEKGEVVATEFSESMVSRIEKGYILPGQMDVVWDYQTILSGNGMTNTVLLSMMEQRLEKLPVKKKYNLTVKSVNPYNKNFDILVKDLKAWKKSGYRVILLSGSKTRAERLAEDLREYELTAFFSEDRNRLVQNGEILVTNGNVHKGFEYPLVKFVIISESDIFGAAKKPKRKVKAYEGSKISSFNDLSIGDYVVHENHGLGIYRGIEKITVDKITKDYIKIEYAGGGVLYILATGLDVLQKYAGADAKKPKLNKLNSTEWKATKARVRGAVKNIAGELVNLYALRQSKKGYAFSEDDTWQREFEELFPYEETDDQLRAIEDTKRDMESTRIMDRLVCGDVGYGKTEIAIRAAFKAVLDKKQVVFLVPTTILAQQHYNTFVQRMKDFAVNIEMLSRFRTPADQKRVLAGVQKGEVDILIGTHRVLSKDIKYKDLGLLMIDEEQRFGVAHKEKIKQMKGDVDVLTLTATPIPRTLHMSLVGIRDMSVLEEPPVDRLPIQTFVLEHNDEIIREAIHRELARNGQVYYVYNRVNGIDEVALAVQRLVPEANVAFAHGQMSERQLEKIMFEFINGEIDVLISTTIIETGLDISNVNTILIDDADRLGLSQLYQLRGRVGRSNRTSYAFLMYKRDKMLKEVAEKRLQAIKEFTELGSGFKIAMRDLEIRGAGNLLGAEQSGHMEAVGYDLYCKMLNEAVKTLKDGTPEEEDFETTVDFAIDAYIPATYIKNEMQKLDMYKRVAGIANEEEFEDLQEELEDRFGELPKPVNHLLYIALIKAKAHECYLTSMVQQGENIKLVPHIKAKYYMERLQELINLRAPNLQFVNGTAPYFLYRMPKEQRNAPKLAPGKVRLFEEIKKLLEDFRILCEKAEN
ncbi:MAG: transcription-repair coupling factor [Lachnospiraceae bacterium]|nr:transcription-repair coupling factor [Lachnospiraceae bacterium]